MAELTGRVHDEEFTINSEALVCPRCDFKTIPKEHMAEFALRIADEYRKAHDLLTSSQIKDCRADLGMSQQQFAQYLGVGVASIKRWELGQIQDGAMNNLMVLKTDLAAAERNVSGVAQRLGKPSWSFGDWNQFLKQMRGAPLQHGAVWEKGDHPFGNATFTSSYVARTDSAVTLPTEKIEGFEKLGASLQMEMVA